MREHAARRIPVVDEGQHAVGIVRDQKSVAEACACHAKEFADHRHK
jgi:CBS-domain-containing membrane protein